MKGDIDSLLKRVVHLRATAQSMREHMERVTLTADWQDRYAQDIARNEQRAADIEARVARRRAVN